EIGTELEAAAARTIAERGVQLVGTAHGNTLENLMANPTLCDLIGGIQSVTLSDEEARRRGTQKSILERMAPPTFDAVIEIQGWRRVALHEDVGATVDAKLRGFQAPPEVRELTDEGTITTVAHEETEAAAPAAKARSQEGNGTAAPEPETRLFPFGLSRGRLVQAIQETGVPIQIVDDLRNADALITLRHSYRKKPAPVREAEERSLPIYVIKSNTLFQMEQVLLQFRGQRARRDPVAEAYRETEEAIAQVLTDGRALELAPANSYIRRVQHELAGRFNLDSESHGSEPERRVRILPEPPRSGGR
ncbi:MAG: AAA family ATPase, partial [Chloroflexi bacterium]|nr:AAA family ATPase [Chloroflexota bacterium]